jgi:hypothetical protein
VVLSWDTILIGHTMKLELGHENSMGWVDSRQYISALYLQSVIFVLLLWDWYF